MEPKQSFLGQFTQRLTTETPKFFRKIITFGILLGSIGTGLLAADWMGAKIPPIIGQVSGYLVTVGVVAGVVAKATTTNPTLQDAGGSLARTPRK